MKTRKIYLPILCLILTVCAFFSCGVDRWPEYAGETEQDRWIDSVMRENYLWNEEIPSSKNLNYFIAPEAFLQSVIYKNYDKNYSHIDSLTKTVQPSYGWNYSLIKNPTVDTLYNALINYVYPDSPASRAGVTRGNWIMKVNGKAITTKTEKQLLKSGQAIELTIGKYEIQKIPRPDKKDTLTKAVVTEIGKANMGAAQMIEEDPILSYSIVTTEQGTTVGYLVYNSFKAGTATDKEKYNNKLLDISRVFASAGVTHVVLDLRYNNGGSFECARLLSTLLAPAEQMGGVFASLQYNDKQRAKDHDLLYDPQLISKGKNLNVSQGFILSSNSTSSTIAGLMLNCLIPLNRWGLIGSSVACPGVTTERFHNPQFLWALYPAVCEVYNSAGESGLGKAIKVTVSADETSDYTKFLPFGNKDEALFSLALKQIDKTALPPLESKNQ